MEPMIVEQPQMFLLGFGFFGDPFEISGGWTEENEIGRIWNRFMTFLEKHGSRIKHVTSERVMYELHVYYEETARTGEFEVFVGLEVEKLKDVPVELSAKIFPPMTYAVFTLQGEQITSDWHTLIVDEWLSKMGHPSAYTYSIQRYDERFKGVDLIDESVLEIYIPIDKQDSAG